jgi:3-phenylpropionate/trans-cinnamate dioxygenase ferredoxin subunit
MSHWIDVVEEGELAPGEVRSVDVEGSEVAVFNVLDEYYAIEDICTHDGSEISSGCLFNYVIECPRHGARFDVRTGEVLGPPAYEPIQTFKVRVENGMIQVRDGSL